MRRILIVDDEPANVMLLEAFLSGMSDEIRSITDSTDAEQAFLEFEPDIVLLDFHMPKPDGISVLRRIADARERRGFVPVIMLTADTRSIARKSALLLGANDFLTKPLDRDEVLLRVRNLLRTRDLYAELADAYSALQGRTDQSRRGIAS
ncbi:MAG TPA: response regulator [Candidatus Dormibacteraeota bacterium]|nr:response regulator [Candidatus Dormibacteraeota bacterium]